MIPVFIHPDQHLSNPQHEWDKRGFRPHLETHRRLDAIVHVLEQYPDQYQFRTPEDIPWQALRSVHSDALHRVYGLAESLLEDEWFFPTSFPKSFRKDPPVPTRLEEAGYYCNDTSTWLSRETYRAACASAASAVAGAEALAKGDDSLVYALSRPPGHHASREIFGGYCYFNNTALAAHTLKAHGKVAVLDIDYHHGDGTQSLFYTDPNVLTVSVHVDPTERYPFFTGFASEQGAGLGLGTNVNVVLPSGTRGDAYLQALNEQAITAIRHFMPDYVVVALGGDTLNSDPVGDFALQLQDYPPIATAIGRLQLPTLVVQEGGYNPDELGLLVHHFLSNIQQN